MALNVTRLHSIQTGGRGVWGRALESQEALLRGLLGLAEGRGERGRALGRWGVLSGAESLCQVWGKAGPEDPWVELQQGSKGSAFLQVWRGLQSGLGVGGFYRGSWFNPGCVGLVQELVQWGDPTGPQQPQDGLPETPLCISRHLRACQLPGDPAQRPHREATLFQWVWHA